MLLMTLMTASAEAQDIKVVRGGCTPDLSDPAATTRGVQRRLPAANKEWDASRVYHQLVILVEFVDSTFSGDDPRGRYDRMLNEAGYNEGFGAGSMADYFREQSGGLFNLQFDVYGPFKTSAKVQPIAKPTAETKNYHAAALAEAARMLVKEYPSLDYKQYDWNGNGQVNQVIFVTASCCGNQGTEKYYGFMWPNTSSFSAVKTPDGVTISNYTASAELWRPGSSCGIGTICHEFTHSLGLPDIYPTSSSSNYYSVCDEWDLMDGGNFTNQGWCPPNYTAIEKMLLGWLTPIELTEPTTITGMKPVSEGGETYIVKHTDKEYLLLENRQWSRWDAGVPGRGLLITHIDYNESRWNANAVNGDDAHFRCDILHADNLDYEQWNVIQPRSTKQWTGAKWMHNRHLSTSPYPWTTDSTTFENRALTDESVPAVKMYNANAAGSKKLQKAITNIQMTDDGLISFDFMGGKGIESLTYEGVNYKVTSMSERTVVVTNSTIDRVLEVPASFESEGSTWHVTGIEAGVLEDCDKLAAIIWNPAVVFTETVKNPNVLLYVTDSQYAPATIKNVVVNNVADEITLTDAESGNDFYCPVEFTAVKISYAHDYGMTSGIGEARGWETLTLPFDVQKVTHSTKGDIVPFKVWNNSNTTKPFWLMELGSNGFVHADTIKANTPYIICMPNHSNYKESVRLNGRIVFSAENVAVKSTDEDQLSPATYANRHFCPNYVNRQEDGMYVLNVRNSYVSYVGEMTEGSKFVANLRPVMPFEAYMTTSDGSRLWIGIAEDMATHLSELSEQPDKVSSIVVYNLNGQVVKVEDDKTVDEVRAVLPAGIYIVNDNKLLVK